MHKQAREVDFFKNIFLDNAVALGPSTGAVNGVNKCFDTIGVSELRYAVTEVEDVPCCIFVKGKFA